MNGKLKQYQVSETLSKSVPELIIMVYGGAVDSLKNAAEYFKDNNYQGGYEAIEKAKKFMVHLYTTLDMNRGGEIAANLSNLYAFLIERMNFIQATKDIQTIDNSIEILENIKEGWIGLADQKKASRSKSAGDNNLSKNKKQGLSFTA